MQPDAIVACFVLLPGPVFCVGLRKLLGERGLSPTLFKVKGAL